MPLLFVKQVTAIHRSLHYHHREFREKSDRSKIRPLLIRPTVAADFRLVAVIFPVLPSECQRHFVFVLQGEWM